MSEKCEGCHYTEECLKEGPVEFCSHWDPEVSQSFNEMMQKLELEPDCSWMKKLPEIYQKFIEQVKKVGCPPKREDPRVTDEEMECIEELCDDAPCEDLCGRLGLIYCCLK